MELLLESEVAALLHRSRRFVRQLRQSGELKWLPGAGRAPLLITKDSVDEYITKEISWHASNYLRASSKAVASGTSRSRTKDARKEQVLGRQIYKSRKSGFRVG
jgi:hypothetical protein